MKLKMPLFRLFGNIERVDQDTRTVVGYCYRNADPGDGWIVPRNVMERMTADYMQYANVREMHQPSAVGKVTDLTWDDNGCLMRAQIVDDQAWEKVVAGVYTSYSIGVKPSKVTRSGRKNKLEEGSWYETSLVDRPADPGSVFTISRAEGDDTEFEVDVDDEVEVGRAADPEQGNDDDITRAAFAEAMSKREKYTLRYAAMDVLGDLLYQVQESSSTNKQAEIRTICAEFADYISPIIGRGEFGGSVDLDGELASLKRSADGHQTEIETLNRAIGDRDATIEALTRRVAELEAQPDPSQPRPVVNAEAVIKRLRESQEAKQSNTDVVDAEREILNRDWRNASEAERRQALDKLAELRRG